MLYAAIRHYACQLRYIIQMVIHQHSEAIDSPHLGRKVVLIHWNREEALVLASQMEYPAIAMFPASLSFLKELEQVSPLALVFSLDRSPSKSRDFALQVRIRKGTRRIPILFVGGTPEWQGKIKALLPDAVCVGWDELNAALRDTKPLGSDPYVPGSVFDPFAHRSAVEKLGIKPGMQVGLINGDLIPETLLQALPNGAICEPLQTIADHKTAPDNLQLCLWFVRDASDLDAGMPMAVEAARRSPIWIASRKAVGKQPANPTQRTVQLAGLAAGLVDYKVCSIDATWTALLFRVRKGGA